MVPVTRAAQGWRSDNGVPDKLLILPNILPAQYYSRICSVRGARSLSFHTQLGNPGLALNTSSVPALLPGPPGPESRRRASPLIENPSKYRLSAVFPNALATRTYFWAVSSLHPKFSFSQGSQ